MNETPMFREALEALEASLRRPSATPTLEPTDSETYQEKKRAELRRHIITPRLVRAASSKWAKQYAGGTDAVRTMIAIAQRDGKQCLLYDPESKEFSLAMGDIAQDVPLELLGFSSDDALGEWLG